MARNENKERKMVLFALAFAILSFVCTSALLVFSFTESEFIQPRFVSAKESKEGNNQSEIVAIVNSDEGIEENGELIVYSKDIVAIPDETKYEFTTLTEAKAGVKNGKYGAYIIIPSNFSKSIASLNSVPEACSLDFVVSKNTDVNHLSKVLHNVYDFEIKLNNDISYMYVSNIMSEFHNAQDSASDVMENDKKDKAAIDSISPMNLVSLVEVPEMKQVENNLQPLDVSSYLTGTDDSIKNIENDYQSYVDDVNRKLENIKSSGNELTNTLGTLSVNATDIEAISNIENIDDNSKISDSVDAAIASDSEKTALLENEIEILNSDVNDLIDTINVSINSYLQNEGLRTQISGKEENISTDSNSNDINTTVNKNDAAIDIRNLPVYGEDGKPLSNGETIEDDIQSILEKTGSGELSLKSMMDSQLEARSNNYKSASEDFVSNVNDGIVNVNTQIDSIRDSLSEDYNNFSTVIENYKNVINENIPDSFYVADESINELHGKTNELKDAVNKNNSAYYEYASQSYETSTENVNQLMNNIEDANTASDNAVKEGVSEAKSIKAERRRMASNGD